MEKIEILNRQTDKTILTFFECNKELIQNEAEDAEPVQYFESAIKTLRDINEKSNSAEIIEVIMNVIQKIMEFSSKVDWNADDLLPVVTFAVVRAKVQHLGALLNMLDDLTRPESYLYTVK